MFLTELKDGNNKLSAKKEAVRSFVDKQAVRREAFYSRNSYYHREMVRFFRMNIPEGHSVLDIGCAIGDKLAALDPSRGTGIDISGEMIKLAVSRHAGLDFRQMDAEDQKLDDKYEYVLISDSMGYFEDIQKVFSQVRKCTDSDSRVVLTFHSFLWQPLLNLLEKIGLKMPQMLLNWLNMTDITNLLRLEGFEVVQSGRRMLFPFYIPVISWIANRFLAHLPVFNFFCLSNYIIARPVFRNEQQEMSVSVIVPARNEKGNIAGIMDRIPVMGKGTEVVFVEGHSSDGTYEEIRKVAETYSGPHHVVYTTQDGTGKGDAVRKGFDIASGEILIILDADMTVQPEVLPRFYEALVSGKGEFINGTRLVYPLEKQAMRSLNMMGNYFFAVMFSWILRQKIRDTLCGTKAISSKNWKKVLKSRGILGNYDPFGDFDLIFGSAINNLSFIEIPVHYKAREYGETNISRFRHGWMLFRMMLFAMVRIKFR